MIVYAILPDPATASECIELFNKNAFLGLLHFDLLGMISYLLYPINTLSLQNTPAKKRDSHACGLFYSLLELLFFCNQYSFSMLSVSKQYMAAETDAAQNMLLSSCQTLLTIFNVQAFMISYIIVSAAWVMIDIVMLSNKYFSRFIGWMAIFEFIS